MIGKQTPQDIGWAFWIQWLLANTIGWIVGMALFAAIGTGLASLTSGWLKTISWGVVGGIAGAVIGVNQWIVLNAIALPRGGKWARGWVLATILGWMVSLVVVVGMGAGDRLGFTVSGAIFGISVGIAQWFVLRTQVEHAEWWGLANTIAWMLGLAGIDYLNRLVGFSLAGVVSGAITGLWLLWLLKHPLAVEIDTDAPNSEQV